jgi:hypothetical protein
LGRPLEPMKAFERLIGEWHAKGEFPDPPMKMSAEATIEPIVGWLFRSLVSGPHV